MATLFHIPPSPYCRKVRLHLAERGRAVILQQELPWARRLEFLAMNAAGTVPVLVDDDGTAIAGSQPIAEYIEETSDGPSMLGDTPGERGETRRLVAWFDEKFFADVGAPLYGERLLKRMKRVGEPSSSGMREGRRKILIHLEYIAWLCERRTWLAGERLSLADLTAGAHLSVIDFLGDVPWDEFPGAKLWYQRIKSRPSFRPLLADQVPGVRPPPHYADLDF